MGKGNKRRDQYGDSYVLIGMIIIAILGFIIWFCSFGPGFELFASGATEKLIDKTADLFGYEPGV